MFAMSLALMATRGWSFRSWRAYPKYGSTAVIRAALARRAASIRNNSSRWFSAGGLVGWMMNTSRPRTFSSILTKISPSAKRRIVTAHSGCPNCSAISSASGRLAVPARSNSWLRESERSAMEALQNRRKLREAKGLLLGGYQRSTGRRDSVDIPRVHAVHGRSLAAHAREMVHEESRRPGIARERQQHAPAAAHGEPAGGAERFGGVHVLGRR